LIIFGIIITAFGAFIFLFPRFNIFGRLPGDITFKRDGFAFYFPVVTSIVLSIVLTLILWVINYFSRR
jgi:hypothetical protein